MPNDATPVPAHDALLEELEGLLLKGLDNLTEEDFVRMREVNELLHPERKSQIERLLNQSPGGAGPSKLR